MVDHRARELVLGRPPAPPLRRPILVAGLGGWGDAGNAASIAVRHILGEEPPAASAMLDPSTCYDFTVARPLTTRRTGTEGGTGNWVLEYPKAAFHPVVLPASADRDLLVLMGPEPHFHWPELAPAVIAYAREAGVEMVITLGAYVGAISHRFAPVTRRTLDAGLDARLAALELNDTDYEGPTTFATALLHAAAAAGIPGASLWVATPPYLQAGNPVAALALLEATQRVVELPLDGEERLREAAASFLKDVDSALEEHPELAEQLKEMLEAEAENGMSLSGSDEEREVLPRWSDPDPDRPPPGTPPGLPSGKALVEAVEKYLQLKQPGGGGSGSGGPGTGSGGDAPQPPPAAPGA